MFVRGVVIAFFGAFATTIFPVFGVASVMSFSLATGGTATYLAVVTAQTLSLTNQRTAVQLRGRLLAAGLSLVAATGGGWSAQDTPVAAAAARPQ